MDNDIIFHETDDDGDSLDVRRFPATLVRPCPKLILVAERSGGDEAVQVRLTQGSVERLRDALNEWLGGDGPVVCPPGVHSLFDPCPGNCGQPLPVRPPAPEVAPEFLRRAALDASVAYVNSWGSSHYTDVLDIASKFETYLRDGNAPTEAVDPGWVRPTIKDLPQCLERMAEAAQAYARAVSDSIRAMKPLAEPEPAGPCCPHEFAHHKIFGCMYGSGDGHPCPCSEKEYRA